MDGGMSGGPYVISCELDERFSLEINPGLKSYRLLEKSLLTGGVDPYVCSYPEININGLTIELALLRNKFHFDSLNETDSDYKKMLKAHKLSSVMYLNYYD